MNRTHLLIISLIYLLINVVLFYAYGIKVVNDSHRYITYATNLRNGFYVDPHNFWYIGFSLYILIAQFFQEGLVAIVVGQYVLSLLAVLALYEASIIIWQNKRSALFTTLFYLLFIDISSWNSYILAESLYTSFICFSVYGIACLCTGRRNFWFVALTVLAVLFTASIKPTGIALLGAVLFVLSYQFVKTISNKVVYYSVLTFIMCVFLLLVNRMLTTYLIMENYQLGEIIYAVSTVVNNYEVKSLILSTPENLYHPPTNYPPIAKIVSFIFHHPIYWLKLFFAKVFSLLFHVRPFWSVWHNLFSLLILIPSYLLFLKAITSKNASIQFVTFSKIFLMLHILSVGITSNDWDGRFLIPMLPVVFLFTSFGLTNVIENNKMIKFKFWFKF